MKMELDIARIEAAVIAEVADKMIGNDELYERAKSAVAARIDKLWAETAEARIRTEVEAAVSSGFEREYHKVNSFGQRDGGATTVRKELERLIGGYWNEMVGKDGKPTTYGGTTRAEWMMTQLVAADFQGGMKQHVVNLGGSLKDALRAELHETVNRLLSDIFHVRSSGDEAAKRSDSSIIRDKQNAPA